MLTEHTACVDRHSPFEADPERTASLPMSGYSRVLEEPVAPDMETEREIGSPDLFGRQLRSLRAKYGMKLSEWAEGAGTDASALSRYERGEQRPPNRETLVKWGKAWQITNGDLIDLMVVAGYIPYIPQPFWQEDRQVLLSAMREVFGPGEGRTQLRGLDHLRSLLTELWGQLVPGTR